MKTSSRVESSAAMVAITAPSLIVDVDQYHDQQIPLVRCPSPRSTAAIPCVDLSAPGAAAAVAAACRRVGFFRAANHGVPARLAEELEARAMAFFALPTHEKEKVVPKATTTTGEKKLDTAGGRPMGYGCKNIGLNGDVGWLEYLSLPVSTNIVSLPPSLRASLENYTAAVRAFGGRVLELIAEGLGVDRSLLRAMVFRKEAGSDELVRVNHYPPCPLPPPMDCCGVTGFGEHTDPQIISVLRSNRTAGLQIKLRDGSWVPVRPAPESFFVNVGDALQVLTNGRFRSVKHRVVVSPGAEPRLSVIYFGGPALSQRIAPLPQLMRDGEQSLYREFTWGQYKDEMYKSRLVDDRLSRFELQRAANGNRDSADDPPRGNGCLAGGAAANVD